MLPGKPTIGMSRELLKGILEKNFMPWCEPYRDITINR